LYRVYRQIYLCKNNDIGSFFYNKAAN
jgi:hypothetical protein